MNDRVTCFTREYAETPKAGGHDETREIRNPFIFTIYTEVDRLQSRLAPTVDSTTPIAVGCKMGVCREHTGVPRNKRSLLSPTI
jgi:hypothetical protein